MLTFNDFAGINNVQPAEDITDKQLAVASNVDIDQAGHAQRRSGYSLVSATAHANLWQADGFVLATVAGDLVNVTALAVLHAGVGAARMWYCPLPDGRTLYANGTTQGIVNAAGTAVSTWGVPIPASAGVAGDAAGLLHAGDYLWALTHTRLADGAEGGAIHCAGPVAISSGGVTFTGLPVLIGYRTNVYLTSHNGGERFLAGSTSGDTLTFSGKNTELQLPCRTEFARPAPAGRLVAFWRGRALVAVGNALFASRPHSWELFDIRRDFKQFSADITLVQPVADGIFVGTEQELAFLAGAQWDQLAYVRKIQGAVVLGSGVAVPGDKIKGGNPGEAMLCIANGLITAGFAGGGVAPLTESVYASTASEVAATFRMQGQIPQYLAIEQ